MNALYVTEVGHVDDALLSEICGIISALLGMKVVRCRIALNGIREFAYDAPRNQYSSPLILRELLRMRPPDTTRLLAFTEYDLFIPMLTYVFGAAQLGGPIAMVSLARLRQEFYSLPPNRSLLLERAGKESAHELGHTFGLTHCHNGACVMSLSTSLPQVDAKGVSYCPGCLRNIALAPATGFSITQFDKEKRFHSVENIYESTLGNTGR